MRRGLVLISWLISLAEIAGIYLLCIGSPLVPYAEVCQKGKYGPPDDCSQYDIVTALVFRMFVFADEHNGIMTAIFTGLLAYITRTLVRSGEKQATITLDMHRARRAFVFVNQVLFAWEISDSGLVFSFRPQWGNSGETHTVDMTTHVNAYFEDHMIPADFAFTAENEIWGNAMIGPKSTITGGSPRGFSTFEIEQVVRGERFLFMWGGPAIATRLMEPRSTSRGTAIK